MDPKRTNMAPPTKVKKHRAPTKPLKVRVIAGFLDAIDAKVARGQYRTRGDFVHEALRAKLDKEGWS